MTASARDRVAAAFEAAAELDDPAVFLALADRDAALADLDPDAPLAGLTVAVKDNIDVAGLPTTAACPAFAHVPTRSATVVARLVAAGATVIGKTNLDQFATGLVGTRSPYGIPRNPVDADLVPGGSSSGSAVAVARGIVDVALGTDTAGSGRVPAAQCGIVGLKPTRGWLSCAGVVPAVRSVDCVSVFSRTVAAGWSTLTTAAGLDPDDALTRRAPSVATPPARRLGIPRRLDLDGADDEAAFAEARRRAAQLDLELVEVDLGPFLAAGRELYGGGLVLERVLAFGDVLADHPDDADPVVAGIIETARTMSALDVTRSSLRLALEAGRAARTWDDVDLLLVPTTPGPATLAEVAAEPLRRNARLGTFTTFANLLDLCAACVPVTGHGPRGVQVLGPAWSDDAATRLAAALVDETGTLTR